MMTGETMTSHQHGNGGRAQFAEARHRAELERTDQQQRAVRTVAGQARDGAEFDALLSMLGLENPEHRPVPLNKRLAAYVHLVAAAIGVSTEATGSEVSDTATAYLGLDQRWPALPDQDLMLVWDERLGWYVAVENKPAEAPVVLAYLDGDTVPTPAVVARFVADAAAGSHMPRIRPVQHLTDRTTLAEKMAAVC
jgi:hypothetical protein